MVARVVMRSREKGSNPGGECDFFDNGYSFRGYVKYCHGSRLQGDSVFVPEHQPVYEGITFELARSLCLDTSEGFVLMNNEGDVTFEDWKEMGLRHNPSGRNFYFLSKLLNNPAEEMSESESQAIINFEKSYLEAIMISDVVGKRQNYKTYGGGEMNVVYLDLGCSFVHAVDGFLISPHRLHLRTARDYKKALKRLNGKSLLMPNQSFSKLVSIVEGVEDMEVNVLNPRGRRKIKDLISFGEIEEIQRHLAQSFLEKLPSLKQAGLILF